jgi:Lactate racemase N-terminal domain
MTSSEHRALTRVPLLYGSRVAVVATPEDALVLRPPAPGRPLADVRVAVSEALRFPLDGPSLRDLLGAGAQRRATIVVEPPALPIPGAEHDPRRLAVTATVEELERAGVPTGYQTILVAGGLGRRAGQRDLIDLVLPELARRFHGHVESHDAEADDLVEIGESESVPLRVHPKLVDTDVVLAVTAAETVLHGGPAAFVGAASGEVARSAGAWSLCETAAAQGWRVGVDLERALARRGVGLLGVSLVLNHPRLGGLLGGYPYEQEALERIARSPLRLGFGLLPSRLRSRVFRSLPLELTTAAVFAGPPSVAHAEALLRGIQLRATGLEERVDAIVLGIPHATHFLPRESPNPLAATYLGLGLSLRLWRDDFPVVDGGTAILLHRFVRQFPHPTQQPYRMFFATTTRSGRDPQELAEAERGAATDERGLDEYRAGRTCHPLLPFADWAGCQPALQRLGHVIIAGCRDSNAARQLGFVPTGSLSAALAMARGWQVDHPRVGFLLSPPYFPLQVGPQ